MLTGIEAIAMIQKPFLESKNVTHADVPVQVFDIVLNTTAAARTQLPAHTAVSHTLLDLRSRLCGGQDCSPSIGFSAPLQYWGPGLAFA